MSLISLRCPKCDGEIQLDEAKEYGFCMYCGNKVVLKETIQKFKLELDNLESLDRLVKNADTFVKFGDYAKAAEFYQKVVNCFPENYQGWLGLFRIKVLCSKNTNDIKRSFNFLERALITADDSTKKGKIKEEIVIFIDKVTKDMNHELISTLFEDLANVYTELKLKWSILFRKSLISMLNSKSLSAPDLQHLKKAYSFEDSDERWRIKEETKAIFSTFLKNSDEKRMECDKISNQQISKLKREFKDLEKEILKILRDYMRVPKIIIIITNIVLVSIIYWFYGVYTITMFVLIFLAITALMGIVLILKRESSRCQITRLLNKFCDLELVLNYSLENHRMSTHELYSNFEGKEVDCSRRTIFDSTPTDYYIQFDRSSKSVDIERIMTRRNTIIASINEENEKMIERSNFLSKISTLQEKINFLMDRIDCKD